MSECEEVHLNTPFRERKLRVKKERRVRRNESKMNDSSIDKRLLSIEVMTFFADSRGGVH
jgi:hypothetical protein